jgi:hypothetical protein
MRGPRKLPSSGVSYRHYCDFRAAQADRPIAFPSLPLTTMSPAVSHACKSDDCLGCPWASSFLGQLYASPAYRWSFGQNESQCTSTMQLTCLPPLPPPTPAPLAPCCRIPPCGRLLWMRFAATTQPAHMRSGGSLWRMFSWVTQQSSTYSCGSAQDNPL